MTDRLARMVTLVEGQIPGFRLVDKADFWFMRWAGALLRPINADFMDHYTVVLGRTVYLPGSVEQQPREQLAATLAHELIHQLDQRRWGPLFYLSYGVLFPVGRTMRAHWERRAYAVDLMLAHAAYGERGLQAAAARILPLFTSGQYGWMWAGTQSAKDFLAPLLTQIRTGTLQQEPIYRDILSAWLGD